MQTARSLVTRSFVPLLLPSCRRTSIPRRICNVRRQATVATSGPAVTATNRAEATLKRFWKTVGIEERDDAFAVTLDKRPLRTPGGKHLLLPREKKARRHADCVGMGESGDAVKAIYIANEGPCMQKSSFMAVLCSSKQVTHEILQTSIASRAIDAFSDKQTCKDARTQLLKYLETDTICFLQTEPAGLVKLQDKHWKPLLEWAQSSFGVNISTTDSFLLKPPPPETIQKFDEILSEFDHWQMAAMERATYTSKSFLIALSLVMRRITAEEAALAAHVEVNSQIDRWGEVEDSHDVDYHDVRRQLGSAACLVSNL